MKKHILTQAAIFGLASSLSADLVYHWTFDTDGSNTVGGVDMDLQSNASISDACSTIGNGALFVSNQNTPGQGGATTQSNIDWSSFANGDERTVSFWARLDSPQETNATMFGSGIDSNGQRFDVKLNGGTNYRVEVQGGGYGTSENVVDGVWHHYAVVLPTDGAQMQDFLFYLDGALIDTSANTNTRDINTATAILRIGDSPNGSGNRDLNGFVDDVRIYDNALNLTEIQKLFNASRLVRCFDSATENVIIGNSIDLDWESTATTSLVISNDQDASTIDALAIGATGSTSVSPTVTTTYTITADGGADVRTVTVNVQTSPDVNSFTSTPDLIYGSGDVSLSWTTASAGRITITDDQGSPPIIFTATGEGQAFLDSGTTIIPGVSTTTVYTITATIAEDGSGDTQTAQTTVIQTDDPNVTLVSTPTVASAASDVTLFFNATSIEFSSPVSGASGTIDDFDDDGNPANGFNVGDSTKDFDTLLAGQTGLIFEVTDGDIAGTTTNILSFSGDTLTLEDDLAADFSWVDYRVLAAASAGADLLEISDGSSTIFSTTDPAVIANGSFVVSNVSADTTFTATASISGFGSAMDTTSFTITGTGDTYEEVVLSHSPIGFYRFEENVGSSVIYDSSGNANHSTEIINPEFLTSGNAGIIGNGGSFAEPDNTGASVRTGVTLSPAGDFSVSALVKPEDLFGDGTMNIVSNRDGAGVGRSLLYLDQNVAKPRTFIGNTQSPGETATVDTAESYLLNAACHLVVTYDSTAQIAYIYLDGTLVAEQSGLVGEFADGPWVIGSHKNASSNNFWDGILDEVAFFDTVLSPAQVTAQNNAFLANTGLGILAFGRDATINSGESVDLFAKIGASATSASIDNGVGSLTPGTSNTIPVSPTTTTTYTIDVDGDMQSVTITVLPPSTITITGSGFDGSGNFFIDVAEGVAGNKVTTSPDLVTPFADATGVSDDGANRFTIASGSLDINGDGKDFFRVETDE